MAETMKALVEYPSGELKLEQVPVPQIGKTRFAPHDVLVEVEYCGICGSDIYKFTASDEEKSDIRHVPAPVVSGHEIVSVVRAVGSAVTSVKPGDRVVHEIVTFFCGHCPACLEGRFNICNTIEPMKGRAHYVTGGGFADYTMWSEHQLHKIPENVSSKAAVLMEPLAGSIHSVITRMGVKAGESVAILGPGARGLLMLQVCKAIGAGPIIMTGITRDEPYRLAMAKKLGADLIVNVEKEDLRKKVAEFTNGIGVDVVLENTGAVEPIAESLDIVRKGGRVMWAGGGIRGGIVAPVDTSKIIVKELDVRGEISQIPYDWKTAIHFASTGRVELESLVTHIYPLERWHDGFMLAATSADCLRVALQP